MEIENLRGFRYDYSENLRGFRYGDREAIGDNRSTFTTNDRRSPCAMDWKSMNVTFGID
jgi:hypothetical protein